MLFGSSKPKTRYACVAGGWFAQQAVLPAFADTTNSELAAIVSGDPEKRAVLGKKYGVPTYSYEQYDELLASGAVDAVYIVLPNTMHKEYTERAARHGKHVLCEKPLAANAAECQAMIDACRTANVKLMTAYRLHFEPANLHAIDAIQQGQIGEPRLFNSTFTQAMRDENTRLEGDLAGGPVMDVGIYCINAARYLFQDDPTEVMGLAVTNRSDPRFREVPEMVSAMMRFPRDRLAMFVCGFGEASVSEFRVVGTKGDLQLDPAYTFQGAIEQRLTVGGKTTTRTFRGHDQVAAEIEYFSNCIREGQEPEPNGLEGLIDVMIIRAIEQSAREGGRAVNVGPFPNKPRPSLSQELKLGSAPAKQKLVNAEPPSQGG